MSCNICGVLGVRFSVVVVLVTGGYFGGAAAQNNQHLAEPYRENSDFVESYDDAANVSGSALVGLRIGSVATTVDPEGTALLVPPTHEELICVRTVTQDGRYSANNPYRILRTQINSPLVKLQPISFRFKNILQDYPRTEFALKSFVPDEEAREGQLCEMEKVVYVPEVSEGASGRSQLNILVNGRSRSVKASLYFPSSNGSAESTSAWCDPTAGNSRIAFDQRCSLSLTGLKEAGVARLQLALDDGFATETREYRVFLSPSATAE